MNSVLDSQAATNDQATYVRTAVHALPVGARGAVVNRTHRVIRERARVMQERRSRARSLMAPLLICSALLLLTLLAVWTGMYQYQAMEAVEADVSALTASDLSNHIMVAMLWFVPVSLALMALMFVRRSKKSQDDEAV